MHQCQISTISLSLPVIQFGLDSLTSDARRTNAADAYPLEYDQGVEEACKTGDHAGQRRGIGELDVESDRTLGSCGSNGDRLSISFASLDIVLTCDPYIQTNNPVTIHYQRWPSAAQALTHLGAQQSHPDGSVLEGMGYEYRE